MRRSALALLATVWCATAAAGAALAEDPPAWNRFEIGLSSGFGRSRAGGTSVFFRDSATPFYTRLSASDAITFDSAAAVHVGGSCTFYFTPAFGVQVGFGYLKSAMTGGSAFRLESFRDAPASRQVSWAGSGEITAVPLFLNVTARSRGEAVRMHVSGGLALFLNAFLAQTPAGIEAVEPVWKAGTGSPPVQVLIDEKLDILQVPISVADTTWTAVGANVGAGLDVAIARNMALSLEARYCLCPVKTFAWDWTPGAYEGLDGKITGWNFTADAARAAGQKTSALRIDPSFFQISAGLRFYFPGPPRD
jgi:opacity protein-like surface antigen